MRRRLSIAALACALCGGGAGTAAGQVIRQPDGSLFPPPAEQSPVADQPRPRAAPEPVPQPAGEPRLVSVPQALVLLHREAADALRSGSGWPTAASDFAQRHHLRVRGDQAGQMLARRLDPDPAIDAYVKWQLLSFGPDLAKLPPDTLKRIGAALPRLRPYPRPWAPDLYERPPADSPSNITLRGPRFAPAPRPRADRDGDTLAGLAAIEDRSAAASEVAEAPDPLVVAAAVERANAELAELRARASHVNGPSLVLRAALLPRLPDRAGLRLQAMITDLRQRLEAGDPAYDAAIDRLIAECERLPPDYHDGSAIPRKMRYGLTQQVRKLGAIETFIVESFRVPPPSPPPPTEGSADEAPVAGEMNASPSLRAELTSDSEDAAGGVAARPRPRPPIEAVVTTVAYPPDKLARTVRALLGREAVADEGAPSESGTGGGHIVEE